MIQSMTGYGKAVCELKDKNITIEIKSLNSKQMDINTRIPGIYKDKDVEIRSIISKTLQRGKVDMFLYVENLGNETSTVINANIFENYKNQILDISKECDIPVPEDLFSTILRLPDALKTEIEEINDEEWKTIQNTLEEALQQMVNFRIQEGKSLEEHLIEKIENIRQLHKDVPQYEKERIERVRTRIMDNLNDLKSSMDFDQNRFEQEMIYYIEKLDISEEKVRLENHLNYFIETLHLKDSSGKKLGFIAQEIGREINTMGSKANHHEIQKLVVQMKDELEQIKEQVLNAL
ncbi:YicC/YloC family endoribonuclease [Saccharicrinis sp. FJH54]|uniref:YicC/YloC family endoribonuclease n=1 Tax=Saccharicrinis sp. FJH54 TaxID=3344665 RepID=UPI0035D4247C